MKKTCRVILVFITLCIFSCVNKVPSDIEMLEEILLSTLPYEMKAIGSESLSHDMKPDSNIIYLIPGYSYGDDGFELSLLGNLKDSYRELEISINQYRQISDSICKTNFIPFNTPKSNKEFEDNVRNKKVLAIILLYKIWVNQNGSRLLYFRSASFKDENFLEGYDSIRFFKKENGKWVFEKEL